ncbi:VOC family protein [Catenulispora sp. EB89]|uniref:VOC family protein n=1 Tax=Catenulispora sp. EB89 TaxID=3156257 RepID=UPI0035165582
MVIDALDVAALERFWTEAMLGRTDGLRLRFVATDRPKSGKNRLHLDLAGGPDWPAEVERLLALGATRADIGQGDVPWDVLADPEGNEFCVLRPGHPGVLADAGLVAICLDIAEEERAEQSAFWMSRSGWTHIESGVWGFRLRRAEDSPVSLVMGPPAAKKTGRNRLRLDVLALDLDSGELVDELLDELLDPAGNEFHAWSDVTARG